jgi:hypothetical protein
MTQQNFFPIGIAAFRFAVGRSAWSTLSRRKSDSDFSQKRFERNCVLDMLRVEN